MPSPNATPTPITPPRVPLIDPRTGYIDRAWYLFFLSLNNVATGVIDDSGLTFSSESIIASYEAALQALAQPALAAMGGLPLLLHSMAQGLWHWMPAPRSLSLTH